jgi:hypothetical protein
MDGRRFGPEPKAILSVRGEHLTYALQRIDVLIGEEIQLHDAPAIPAHPRFLRADETSP